MRGLGRGGVKAPDKRSNQHRIVGTPGLSSEWHATNKEGA